MKRVPVGLHVQFSWGHACAQLACPSWPVSQSANVIYISMTVPLGRQSPREGAFEQGEITSPWEQELPERAEPPPIKTQIMTDIEY